MDWELASWRSRRISPSSVYFGEIIFFFSMPVKRKARTNSSKDFTPSPDDKKIKKDSSSVSSQTDDEIFEALNMAEDLGRRSNTCC